ncbi:MAG: His/Gly/Thr/Pro-type tRNA ligase C-terminal domain-containing protein, partial [Fimbriimonadaceae bacterium]|nr:His/Gly/Thr/Pro-type tRNA ligase C-terminal domain-containing protein [Fimbriimonadaceae bacterium]
AIQAGTSHHLGQNFAKAFDVTFQSAEGTLEHVYATSWGVSTRLVGTLLMVHSDDQGFVCPPRLAPIQVVIIPIGRGEDREKVLDASASLAKELRDQTYGGLKLRVHIDTREKESPGFKFNHWEQKGACLRIELGPRDLAEGKAVVARRDDGEKTTLLLNDLAAQIPSELAAMHDRLFARALQFQKENTKEANSWDEFQEIFRDEGGSGFVLAHWDGTEATEDAINDATKATIRCIPFLPEGAELEPGACVYSGKPSKGRVIFAKSY